MRILSYDYFSKYFNTFEKTLCFTLSIYNSQNFQKEIINLYQNILHKKNFLTLLHLRIHKIKKNNSANNHTGSCEYYVR